MVPVTPDQINDILNVVGSIFKKRPNKNDWKGWLALDRKNNLPDGTNAVSWVIKDGDSVQNEALNILSFMNAQIDGKQGLELILGHNSHFNRNITSKDIAAKLRRAGMHNEANDFDGLDKRNISTAPVSSFFGNLGTSIFNPSPKTKTVETVENKKAGFNFLTTGLILTAAIAFGWKYIFGKGKRKFRF